MKLHIQLPYHEDQYTIDTACEEILYTLHKCFGIYCCPAQENAGYSIVIEHTGDKYTFALGEHSIITADPVGQLHNLMFTHKKICPGIFALHAGGVCHKGKAYIFCAATTTGKTTLTAYLTQTGLQYISDDCIFLDMESLSVYPCHNPIHLRDGGYNIFKQWGTVPSAEYIHDRYVYTPSSCSPPKMELGKIFFIQRTDTKNGLQIPPKAEILQTLMVSPLTAYPMNKEYIIFLNRLLRYCHNLQYCDMEYVRTLITTSEN